MSKLATRMRVQTTFSIKDLENLSGVKAHTIRMWEKRYNLLSPTRSETNIRSYDLRNLKKLFNVTYLYVNGHKISKIASLDVAEINQLVSSSVTDKNDGFILQSLKTAMFDFDYVLFQNTVNKALETRSFSNLFFDIFIPLLEDLGVLWHAGTVDPSHERFVSEMIRQKTMVNVDIAQRNFKKAGDTIFTLFLPSKESHEIGLQYAQYEILTAGFQCIYLGAEIPLDNLNHVSQQKENVIFLTYLTTKPESGSIKSFIDNFNKKIYDSKPCELVCMGNEVQGVSSEIFPKHIHILKNLKELQSKLEELKNA